MILVQGNKPREYFPLTAFSILLIAARPLRFKVNPHSSIFLMSCGPENIVSLMLRVTFLRNDSLNSLPRMESSSNKSANAALFRALLDFCVPVMSARRLQKDDTRESVESKTNLPSSSFRSLQSCCNLTRFSSRS